MDIQKIVVGEYVDLERMMAARERRQALQQALLSEYSLPLISFTLNIVGPVKVFSLAVRTFFEGLRLIQTQCLAWRLPVIAQKQIKDITGYEAFLVIDGEPKKIKEILCRLEECTRLGRLFDLDVIQTDGKKVSREDFEKEPRKCLICSQNAFVCSRSRAHTVEELLQKECEIMTDYFNRQYASHISSLCMRALLYEVAATPKPGLVDRNNSGAHKDMDFYTFQRSAVSLNRFFEEFTLCGILNCRRPHHQIFALLRSIGLEAEQVMRQATGGVNTHKGMIFSLGIFCCVLGYLYGNQLPFTENRFVETCMAMTSHLLEDFNGITEKTAKTHGEMLYAKYGVTGIRGEAAGGYPTVFHLALPVFRGYIAQGYSANNAGVFTLLHIIANASDTNLLARSDYETMKQVQKKIGTLLEKNLGPHEYLKEIQKLDDEFIQKNLSPGGSADMLALTYFIYSLEEDPWLIAVKP